MTEFISQFLNLLACSVIGFASVRLFLGMAQGNEHLRTVCEFFICAAIAFGLLWLGG